LTSAALSSKRFLVKGLRHFLLAVQFFTRIPITGALAQWVGYSPAMLRASSAHFPSIGWLMGGVAAAVACGTVLVLTHAGHSPLASGLVAAALSTVATVWLTGAFHEDGLADVADGLGGSYDRTRALDIMKDSRVGAFGALALVLIVAVKVALIASLAARAVQVSGLGWQWAVQLATCLLFAHVLSRFAPLCVIRALPHVGDLASSKSKPLADQISGASLGVALVWCIPAFGLGAWTFCAIEIAVVLLAGAVALAYMGRLFQRRLQGFTGDCLGATQQVCEVAMYLAMAALPLRT
jgi:adenosylcobinamide-GDP ribazoletransferase